MTIGKTAYMPTFTTIDKAVLREYQKKRCYTTFLCLQVEIILKKLLLSPAPPTPSQFPLQLFAGESGSC